MKSRLKYITWFFLPLLVLLAFETVAYHPAFIRLNYPKSWPEPVYDFSKNPLSAEGIQLGRKLFYDPILSKDNTISCSSCHLSYTAFTHVDHALSHGINDQIGTRNSLALMNLAWSTAFMWDGAINHLDMQALAPISHPAEMGEDIAHVVQKLQSRSPYPALFKAAFGDSLITGEHFLKAMAQFELTLISANARYDRVMAGQDTFTEQEKGGYILFKKNCARCHTEPFFTNRSFARNNLPMDTFLQDAGRMRITKDPADSLFFKVPSLRNLEFSYPYMHDGRFRHLSDVLNYYAQSESLGIRLNAHDKVDLMAFLLTLTDKEFLFNPDFAFPRN